MRRLLASFLFVIALFVLAACGADADTPADATDTTATDSAVETAQIGFTATLTGAVETEITSSGYFLCDEVGLGEWVIGASGSLSDNVLFTLPKDAAVGTYQLTAERTSAEQASAIYVGSDLQDAYYDENVTGTLTLDAAPANPGDRIAGSFAFSATADETSPMVIIAGTFDFLVGEVDFFNCPSLP